MADGVGVEPCAFTPRSFSRRVARRRTGTIHDCRLETTARVRFAVVGSLGRIPANLRKIGWGSWIRTTLHGVKVRCLAGIDESPMVPARGLEPRRDRLKGDDSAARAPPAGSDDGYIYVSGADDRIRTGVLQFRGIRIRTENLSVPNGARCQVTPYLVRACPEN